MTTQEQEINTSISTVESKKSTTIYIESIIPQKVVYGYQVDDVEAFMKKIKDNDITSISELYDNEIIGWGEVYQGVYDDKIHEVIDTCGDDEYTDAFSDDDDLNELMKNLSGSKPWCY